MTDHTEAERAKFEAAPLGSYSDEDQCFFKFWYGHMKDDAMTGPLASVDHATARLIWDSARATQASAPATQALEVSSVGSAPADLLEEAMRLARLYSAADANSADYRGDDKALTAKLERRVVESQVALRKFLAAHLRAQAAGAAPPAQQ